MPADIARYSIYFKSVYFQSVLRWVHQVYKGRTYPSITIQVKETQHVAFFFWPYSCVCLTKCCFYGTSIWEEEEPQPALDYKDAENKDDELPAACQIQLEQSEDTSRRQSEDSKKGNRLQTATACMANRAACVTRLFEHVNKTAANRGTVWWLRPGMEMMILAIVSPWTLQSPEQIWDFHAYKISSKQLTWHKFLLQEHLGIIALSDFSLCTGAAQNVYFYPLVLTNVKIMLLKIIPERTLEAYRPLESFCFPLSVWK